MKELIIILIGAAFVNNVVLSQFRLCPFLEFQKDKYSSMDLQLFCYHTLLPYVV